jgi:hypothetical protein
LGQLIEFAQGPRNPRAGPEHGEPLAIDPS